jgi:hypothetical protein
VVEEPVVYSKLFWIRKYGKCDSDSLVLIVTNCSAFSAFNSFAVVYVRVNLLELFFRWGAHFKKYFSPL